MSIWGQATQFFYGLGPHEILKATESLGIRCNGPMIALNSMENRVYQIELERPIELPEELKYLKETISPRWVVAKFYRPGRWSFNQLQEEHQFLALLSENEVPVIPPLKIGTTSLHLMPQTDLYFALFPRFIGRPIEELTNEDYLQTGRLLGRIHSLASTLKFQTRPKLDSRTYIDSNINFFQTTELLPEDFKNQFLLLLNELSALTSEILSPYESQVIHGDAHRGNLLKHNEQLHFVDFDDSLTGPIIQDIWPLLPDRPELCQNEINLIVDGYESIATFPFHQLKGIEALRTLRMVNYAAWIGRRFEDPAFKESFPYFSGRNHWSQLFEDFKIQKALIQTSEPIKYWD